PHVARDAQRRADRSHRLVGIDELVSRDVGSEGIELASREASEAQVAWRPGRVGGGAGQRRRERWRRFVAGQGGRRGAGRPTETLLGETRVVRGRVEGGEMRELLDRLASTAELLEGARSPV